MDPSLYISKSVFENHPLKDEVTDLGYELDSWDSSTLASALYIGNELFGIESVEDFHVKEKKFGDESTERVVSDSIIELAYAKRYILFHDKGEYSYHDVLEEIEPSGGEDSGFRRLGKAFEGIDHKDLKGLAVYLWKAGLGDKSCTQDEIEKYDGLRERIIENWEIP